MTPPPSQSLVRIDARQHLVYSRSVSIDVAPEVAFDFCASRRGFERHFPHRVRDYRGPEQWELGTCFEMRYRVLGLWLFWRGEVVAWERPQRFVDIMHAGSFASFRHEHEFEPVASGTRYTDRLTFTLGYGGLVDRVIGMRLLERTFAERQRRLQRALEQGA